AMVSISFREFRAFERAPPTIVGRGSSGKRAAGALVRAQTVHYVQSLSDLPGRSMQFSDGIVGAIGNTPLIKLRRASEATGCTILGKAEFMNPGQSVKDRAALFIIQDAVRRGTLRPGGVIVEGTAGNTGIGLALVGNALGFRSVIVIPDTQSQEKKDTLR